MEIAGAEIARVAASLIKLPAELGPLVGGAHCARCVGAGCPLCLLPSCRGESAAAAAAAERSLSMVRPERPARMCSSVPAMLVCLASSVGGQEPVPLATRAQSLVDEITRLEAKVVEWETRATAAETAAERVRKENEALR